MTPAERAIVRCREITDTQRTILLEHLDRPHLGVDALAAEVGRSRRAVYHAMRLGRGLGLLTSESAPTCTTANAVTSESAPTCTTEPQAAPAECTAVHSAVPAQIVTTPPKGGADQLSLVGMVEQPIEQPKPKRKGRPLNEGTGLTRPELRQLAEACRQARQLEGLDVRLWDTQRAESVCRALLVRGMTGPEVLAWSVRVPAFSRGSIELAMNQGATARRTGGVRHAAREDADAKAQRAAAVAEWEAAQAAAKGG